MSPVLLDEGSAPAIELWMMVYCLRRDDILHQLVALVRQLESLAHLARILSRCEIFVYRTRLPSPSTISLSHYGRHDQWLKKTFISSSHSA